MIVNHRPLAPEQTEYTMALSKLEFIAIQCALRYVTEDLQKVNGTSIDGVDLLSTYSTLNEQIHNPNEL